MSAVESHTLNFTCMCLTRTAETPLSQQVTGRRQVYKAVRDSYLCSMLVIELSQRDSACLSADLEATL